MQQVVDFDGLIWYDLKKEMNIMKESKLSFKCLSPRLMGLIAGFMWLSYHTDQLFDLFMNVGKKLVESSDSYMGLYDEELYISYSTGDIVSIAVSSVIGIIIAVGLLKNHPKIVLAGTIISAFEGAFYLVQNVLQKDALQEDMYYSTVAFNAVSVISFVLMIISLVSFREFMTKMSFMAVAVINAVLGIGAFIWCLGPAYGAEDIMEGADIVLSALDASGFLSKLLIIGLYLYVLVLITYEGTDVQDGYDAENVETYYYISMKKHLALLFFIFPVWFFVWSHRTVKVINEIKGEYSKYKPGTETLKMLIPLYSLYWFYVQGKRLEEEFNKCGAEEDGIGMVAVIADFLTSCGGFIYLQDKINEYCIISNKKLRKKAKYEYDENEGITHEYPVDTTEQKPTEIIFDE